MTSQKTIRSIWPATWGKPDVSVLIFLMLVLNVKLVVKVAVIAIFATIHWRSLSSEIIKNKFILFYVAMIGIALLNLLLHFSNISWINFVVVLVGCGFWALSSLSAAINTQLVKTRTKQQLLDTITIFFILNAVVTLVNLGMIIIETGAANPFTYQGIYQKYFINTGDWMKGISFDMSTTNALMNAFGVIFFLGRQKMWMVLICVAVLLLTASNFTNIILVIILVYVFIFQSNRNQKSMIVVCFALILMFQIKVTPENNVAVFNNVARMTGHKTIEPVTTVINKTLIVTPDTELNADQRRQKVAMLYLDSIAAINKVEKIEEVKIAKPFIPHPSIHSAPFQHHYIRTDYDNTLLAFAEKTYVGFDTSMKRAKAKKYPGKFTAFKQTIQYFKDHPLAIVTGTGTGQFASKLAFRVAGLQIVGGYPSKLTYRNDAFVQNHLFSYLTYFCQNTELHSLIHSPDSFYDQLLAEYGIAGVAVFVVLYLAYFIKQIRRINYNLPLLMLLLAALTIGYWYEQLSIVILFELLVLINNKEIEVLDE